jgi:hypothetical protein
MRIIAIGLACFLLLASIPASAETAGQLLDQCEQLQRNWVIRDNKVYFARDVGEAGMSDMGKCWGYLNAYFDLGYIRLLDRSHPNAPAKNPLNVCLPSMHFSQFVRIFLHEANNHPRELNENAYFMLNDMMVRDFPCGKK